MGIIAPMDRIHLASEIWKCSIEEVFKMSYCVTYGCDNPEEIMTDVRNDIRSFNLTNTIPKYVDKYVFRTLLRHYQEEVEEYGERYLRSLPSCPT